MKPSVKVLLLDIGGVLLTDGWETPSREKAAAHFGLDAIELNQRHRNVFDAYESGKMTLDEYLQLVVFYQERPFTSEEFKNFIMAESKAHPDMLKFMTELKQKNHLPIIAVNNEPKELNEHRIKQFSLTDIIDIFVSSCYVNVRKPDKKIYEIALNISQVKPEQALYIDDRQVYIELATQLGIHTIHHTHLEATKAQLATYGFSL